MNFSLALCTYNRSALLAQALESLAACHRPAVDWELLLIDNNSSDDTAAVAQSFAARLPLRYIFERTQGLSHARNRALRDCRGEVLLFTDDDVRFDTGWLLAYQGAFAAELEASWFGGRIRPLWPHGSPPWLRDEGMALIAGLMVRYDLGGESRRYQPSDPAPFGASFALRRSAFERAGLFRPDLGVTAQTPGRGEEAEYLGRLRQAGVPGYYVGNSSAWHWQDPQRFRWPYLYRYGIQKGIAEVRVSGASREPSIGWLQEARYGGKALVQLLMGRGDRARQCVINMGILRGLRHRQS
jgi:glycosyltransferase involved in cell wall biosynthesis